MDVRSRRSASTPRPSARLLRLLLLVVVVVVLLLLLVLAVLLLERLCALPWSRGSPR